MESPPTATSRLGQARLSMSTSRPRSDRAGPDPDHGLNAVDGRARSCSESRMWMCRTRPQSPTSKARRRRDNALGVYSSPSLLPQKAAPFAPSAARQVPTRHLLFVRGSKASLGSVGRGTTVATEHRIGTQASAAGRSGGSAYVEVLLRQRKWIFVNGDPRAATYGGRRVAQQPSNNQRSAEVMLKHQRQASDG